MIGAIEIFESTTNWPTLMVCFHVCWLGISVASSLFFGNKYITTEGDPSAVWDTIER